MNRFVAILIGLMAIFSCADAFTEENLTPQENAFILEEIVVTATKTGEMRKDIPNSVILKDALDIRHSPISSIGELLANELGVDWRTYGNYGGASESINIRGMSSDETQVMVNGTMVNSPSLGSAEVGRVPLNSVERIEVVKGAGSVLYGSGAMAGTVNVITKNPKRDRVALKAGVSYGSENSYKLSAEHGMFAFGDAGYYLTANKIETDGFRDNSDLDHRDASLKLVLDKGNALNVSLYGAYLDRDYGLPGVAPGAAFGNHVINGTTFYTTESASLVNHGGDEDVHATLKFESAPNDWLDVKVQGSYLDMENSNTNRYNAGGWTTVAGEGLESVVENRILEVEGNLAITPFEGGKLLVGMSYEDLDWDTKSVDLDISGNEKMGTTVTNDASIYTRGVYAEVQYRPFQMLKVTAGVRNERHSTFGDETIPRYGLVINPTESTVFKASYGKHFKAPTPNDLFWPEDDYARGNPDLSPQTGWHTDLSLEQELFNNKLFVEVSYFDWNVDGKITWAPNPAFPGPWGDKWTPTNLNESNGSGFELGIKASITSYLDISAGYTYTDAEEKLESVTRNAKYVPTHQFKADMTYNTEIGMTIMASVRYTGEREFFRSDTDIVPTDIYDAYTTVDLKVDRLFLDHWRIFLQAANLFDEGYDTYAEQFTDSDGNYVWSNFPGAGRSLFLGLSYEY